MVKIILENISSYDLNNIFIGDRHISFVSQKVYGGYDYIDRYLTIKKGTYYSLSEIECEVPEESREKLIPWIQSQAELVDKCCEMQAILDSWNLTAYPTSKSIGNDKEVVTAIKSYLDSVLDVVHIMKLFLGYEGLKDEMFYGDFSAAYMELNYVVSIYNMIRNYVTKKPYSTEKVKLNFSRGTFLNGWDLNKESDNLGTILIKDNKYYLHKLQFQVEHLN